MTRSGLALAVALGLLGLIVLGAAAGAAGLVVMMNRSGAQDLASAMPSAQAPQEVLLAGQSEAIAASALQARLRGAAQSAGIRLTRIEMRPPADAGLPLAALIEARGMNNEVLRFLHELESGMPAIVTHEARIARAAPLDSGQIHSELVLAAEFHAWHGRTGGGS